jgi:hypothetical protein
VNTVTKKIAPALPITSNLKKNRRQRAIVQIRKELQSRARAHLVALEDGHKIAEAALDEPQTDVIAVPT